VTTTAPVRLGFIGAGGIVHRALAAAAHAADGVVVQAAAARDAHRAETVVQPVGGVYADYQELLDDPDVDLVYITLDNAGHLPWALAALAAGKHVLCEKPLGLDPAAVQQMTAAAKAADRLLVEAFWYRWHPRTRRLEQLIRQGGLGRIERVRSVFSFNGPLELDPGLAYRHDPARGGGGLYDVGCYTLSLAHLVLGPDLSVLDVDARWSPSGVDVELTATLQVPGDGAIAEIGCGISAPDSQVISVAGEAATVSFGQPTFMALGTPVDLTITTPDRAVRRESFAPVNPYQLMIEAVGARIRGEDPFLVDLDHSLQVARTTQAIQAALARA
jgi:predicted dehydrogenase